MIETDWQLALKENKIWGGKKIGPRSTEERGQSVVMIWAASSTECLSEMQISWREQWSKGVSQVRDLCLYNRWFFQNTILSCFSDGAECCFKGLNDRKAKAFYLKRENKDTYACAKQLYVTNKPLNMSFMCIVAGTDHVMFVKSIAVYQTVKNILVVFSAKILNSMFMWYSFLLEL